MDLKEDGSFRLNLDFFNYCTGLTMTNGRFDELFGGPPGGGDALAQREMDLAPRSSRNRGSGAPAYAFDRKNHRLEEAVPRGRRGTELCRQRQGPARHQAPPTAPPASPEAG